ncbi:MAG: response regulator [Spirochaetes bacterium]|nr:response regulator [Spirochaetota bacterium]
MRHIKILVVDDEQVINTNIGAYLEDEGFSVRIAASGEEGLQLLKEEEADVGIIDMRLPGMDGNSFILKAHEICPEMKFIIHTGSTNYSLPPALKEIGVCANYVFRKPVQDMSKIVDAIRMILEKATDESFDH